MLHLVGPVLSDEEAGEDDAEHPDADVERFEELGRDGAALCDAASPPPVVLFSHQQEWQDAASGDRTTLVFSMYEMDILPVGGEGAEGPVLPAGEGPEDG